MELVAASVVHFVNSSYPLPVDEILYFDKLCILFFNNWEGLGQTFLKLLLSLFHENYIVERNRKRV